MANGVIEGAEAWDAVAENYRTYAEPHTAPFAADAWRVAGAPPDAEVLDIAAGTGAFTLAALAGGAQVTATDLSPAMVAALNARLADEELAARAQALVMDGQALDLPDDRFNLTASIFGVILFPDPERGLAEMARVTRPGGRVVVGAWQGEGSGAMALFLDAYHECFPEKPRFAFPEAMQRLMTAGGVEAALAAAGLERIESHPITRDWTFPGADWLREHADRLYAFAPLWTQLDGVERARMVDRMIDRLADLPSPAIPSHALIALGTKS